MENDGLSHQRILSRLETFSEVDRQIVIDYYNQKAKFEGLVNRLNNKIDQEAKNRRESHTFRGTINGEADLNNIRTISDGTNLYTLASGNITTDQTGKITGSTSGLIIGVDENGDFVQLSDTDGYSVLPVTQTLAQYEEGERIMLQEQVSEVIDPNGMMEQQQQVAQL
jgi:hypothetical protein